MSIEEHVERVVERIRAVWGVCTAVGGVWVLVTFPWWAIIPFILLSVVTYFTALYVGGIWLALTLQGGEQPTTLELTEEDLDPTKTQPAGVELGTVVKTSDAIGRYMDQHIFDWIEVFEEDGVNRYEFEQVAPRDRAGNIHIPRRPDLAYYKGGTYRRAST